MRSRHRSSRGSRPPEHANFHAHLRIFLGVVASMVLFFLLVLYIAKKNWQLKEEARRKSITGRAQTVGMGSSRMARNPADATATSAPPDSEVINEALLLTRRAELLQASGQTRQAVEMYEQALTVWPTLNQARSELGRLYIRQRSYNKALPVLEAAVSYEPDSAALLNDLAVANLYLNRPQKSLELLEAAARFDPQFAPARFNLALCHLLRTDRPAARTALEQYLALSPEDPKALKEIAFLEAAEGRYEEAYLTLQKALAKTPDWPPLVLDAAATAALMGNMEQAISYLEKAEGIIPAPLLLQSYRGPAFREIRKTEPGKALENRLAEKIRSVTGAPPDPGLLGNEPLLSTRNESPPTATPERP